MLLPLSAVRCASHGGRVAYVELKGLNKSFAGKPAVRDFGLSMEQGEFVSLLGPSGCG